MFDCNYGGKNTGVGCSVAFSTAKKLIFVPYFNAAGAINTIDTTSPYLKATFDALINQADLSQRWFPLPAMKNASYERDVSLTETFNDNSVEVIGQGVKKFTGMIVAKDASPQLNDIILSFRNFSVGCYVIDKNKNLIGSKDSITPTNLNPIRIDAGSIDAIFNEGDDKAIKKNTVMFNAHVDEYDGNIAGITMSELGFDISTLNGLRDVFPTYSLIATSSTDSFTLKLYTIWGSLSTPQNVTGMVSANFIGHAGVVSKVYDITAAADVSITSVTEILDATTGRPTGVYNIVLGAAITAGHVVQVNLKVAGYDFTPTKVATFVSV